MFGKLNSSFNEQVVLQLPSNVRKNSSFNEQYVLQLPSNVRKVKL